jgi:ubiquitin carboxyl-terminal hydrolase 1
MLPADILLLAIGHADGALLPRPDGPTAVRGGSHSGIVNMSGTFCFLNAILQVLASSPRFLSHAYAVLALSATPVASTSTSSSPAVTAALLPFLLALATPSDARHPRPLRPTELVEALRGSEAFKKAGMFGRLRDQQDAHELWALLAGAVDDEAAAVSKMVDRSAAGLRSLLPPTLPSSSLVGSDGEPPVLQAMPHLPWSGRMAYRRACVVCGYSEGIRLMRSGEVSLSLPERTVRRLLKSGTASLSRLPADGFRRTLPLTSSLTVSR